MPLHEDFVQSICIVLGLAIPAWVLLVIRLEKYNYRQGGKCVTGWFLVLLRDSSYLSRSHCTLSPAHL